MDQTVENLTQAIWATVTVLQNSAAVGAAIGLTAGLILAAAEDSSDEDESETDNNAPVWGEM